MTLGLVAAREADWPHVEALARTARRRGLEVGVFLMDEAVSWAADARASALLDEGCDVWACGLSLTRAGLEAVRGVVAGSQDDHAALVHRADKVVAFA